MQSQLTRRITNGKLRLRWRWRHDTVARRSFFSQWNEKSFFLPDNVASNSSHSRLFRTTALSSQRLTGSVMAPHGVEAVNVSSEVEDDEEVERFAAHCMSQLLPRYRSYAERREISSLDLELGDGSVWDDPWDQLEEEEAVDDDDDIEEEDFTQAPSADRPQPHRKPSAMELLLNFDPQNPPSSDDPDELQLWLECEARQEEVHRYQQIIDSARDRKDYSSLSMVQRQILRWFQPLRDEIAMRQKEYVTRKEQASKSMNRYGPHLCILPPEKLTVIVAHEALMYLLLKSGQDGREGVSFLSLVKRIGEAVEEEVLIHRTLYQRFKAASELRRQEANNSLTTDNQVLDRDDDQSPSSRDEESIERLSMESDADLTHKWAYGPSHLRDYLDEVNGYGTTFKKRRAASHAIRRARKVLEKEEEWSVQEKIQLGVVLFQALLEKAAIHQDGKEEMAFSYEKRWYHQYKALSFVTLNDRLYKMIVSDKLQTFGATTTRYKPMIRPPKPWMKSDDGGYLWLKADLMRYRGNNLQKEALSNADMSTVFDGLNALGRVPWRINRRILDVANSCWEQNVSLGDIPARTDYELPPEPIPPKRPSTKLDEDSPQYQENVAEYHAYREALAKHRRIKQKNMDLRSLRCSVMLKLDQAEKFQEFDEIFFPYNIDFRGRAYPVPPHLSNVGSDLCRGMLRFAEAKPLGPRGLYWLKVHLANFAGKDKMSFDDRANFVDESMDRIRESVEDPFAGERWWLSLEDPFQGLATCVEIVNAIDSGDPESFQCSLPVHMDGSCNGLQHYAALGRDPVGGKAVNLCNDDEPQDVYVGVMHEVIRRVAEEAERQLDFDTSDLSALSRKQKKEFNYNRAAKLVDGLIDRGVVKRTVMTSVYGVTFIGARQQIQEKIESKLEAKGHDIDEMSNEIFNACGYLATVTMDVMGDLFTGAKETMNWLTTCARLISQHSHPVAWFSPIGIPVIQPYRQKRSATLVTLMQAVTLSDESDDLPIHKQRQVSAFPPNYVHSLDSSHMLLTALEMDRRGLTFSAVHDSFWTHACDIDEMNMVLREVFVDLYDQPLLERLRKSWQIRYPDLEFPELPERGKLDLNEVKKAPYFFQ